MLNFKVGKIYKDTNGNDWVCIGYDETAYYPYSFRRLIDNLKDTFFEREDNSVTQQDDGSGAKIPFVEEEEKEREWVVGEEYECYNTIRRKITKAKLKRIDKTDRCQTYCFEFNDDIYWFFGKGEIVSNDHYLVFKNGIPQELKDRINKGKLTNERKCFKKGRTYKNHNGASYKFKKRIKTQRGLLAVFEKEDGLIYFDNLYKVNNIECIPFSYSSVGMFLCADESIRNGNASEAVRIKE